MNLAILAAGKPAYRQQPSAAEEVLSHIPAAKWTMSAAGADPANTQIVVGYGSGEVQAALPEARLRINPDWQSSGSVGSFFHLDFDEHNSVLTTYSDIVFSRRLVENLHALSADVVVAWDEKFLSNFGGTRRARVLEAISVEKSMVTACGFKARNFPDSGFFPGVIKFSPQALAQINAIPQREREELSKFHMSELVQYLKQKGAAIQAVECSGQWARIEEPAELARFVLGSKADSLLRLKPLVSKSHIPETIVFRASEYFTRKHDILQKVFSSWPEQDLVVRSSACAEDTFQQSMAGAFLSVLGVSGRGSVEAAIEQVIASYTDTNPDNQVFVQPMIRGLIANGVVFTRSLGQDLPWITVNFEVSERSDGITSGKSKTSLSLNIFRPTIENWIERAKPAAMLKKLPKWIPHVLEAVHELEEISHHTRLDIEFGVDSNSRVHVFQVRPLASIDGLESPSDADFELALAQAELEWEETGRAIFSNMTDWNPAEILGAAPGELAVSLYEKLITNDVWSESRASFGYRRLSNRPLLKRIAGRPYVDVSASIESLLPAGLRDEDSEALLDFFLDRLKDRPDLHDKVEFDVVPTCLTPKFPQWKAGLSGDGGFSDSLLKTYRECLREITKEAIRSIDRDFDRLTSLATEFKEVLNKKEEPRVQKLEHVLSICQLYGTFPFANLARRAFIAVTLLKDAAEAEVISSTAVGDFLSSIRSISHDFGTDALAVRSGSKSWDAFVSDYGHLRPGTYDITSPRYDSEPERFLRPLVDNPEMTNFENVDANHWATERSNFFEWVQLEIGEFADAQIETFLRSAIEGRESAKFAFTRLLSWALEEIKLLARDRSLSIEDISHLRIEEILEAIPVSTQNHSVENELSRLVGEKRRERLLSSLTKIPAFISATEDLFVFTTGYDVPNFIGTKAVIGTSFHLGCLENIEPEALAGKIVFIEAADPGFDWIFGHGISGLVTKYGGANSHMAIRAAEFRLPAALGVGESLFDTLLQNQTIELDPVNQIIRGF